MCSRPAVFGLAIALAFVAGFGHVGAAAPRGSITLHLKTIPAAASQSFSFRSTLDAFQLSDGGVFSRSNLDSGTYRFTQVEPPGWNLDDISCTGSYAIRDVAKGTLSVNIYPGTDVDCSFTERKLTRYVAFGDSVPYGTGLVNPDYQAQSGLPPNQGPWPQAYPSLVASALGLTMEVRPTFCDLGGDNLAVSGATVSRADTLDADEQCPNLNYGLIHYSTRPHKAVDPEEIASANLVKDPPALITVQVGADDIDFAGCLKADLSFGILSANCTQGPPGSRQLVDLEKQRLQQLETGLDKALTTMERQAPGARIALISYFQEAASSRASLVNDGSLICAVAGLFSPDYQSILLEDSTVITNALNHSLASVAAKHPRVQFVDVSNTFAGHEMCTAGSAIFTDNTWRGAHPTQQGQQLLATAIEAAMGQQ